MNNTTHDNYPEYPEGGKRASGGRRRKKKKQSRALYYVILLILLGVLVFSAVKIISYFKQMTTQTTPRRTTIRIRPQRRRTMRPLPSTLKRWWPTIPMWWVISIAPIPI